MLVSSFTIVLSWVVEETAGENTWISAHKCLWGYVASHISSIDHICYCLDHLFSTVA